MGTQGNESPESTPCSTWIPDSYSGTVVILSPNWCRPDTEKPPWPYSSRWHTVGGLKPLPLPTPETWFFWPPEPQEAAPSQPGRCLLCRKLHTNSSLSGTGRCRICCPSSEPRLEKEQVLEPEYLASLPSWLLHYLPPSHPFRQGLCWIWWRARPGAGSRGEDTIYPEGTAWWLRSGDLRPEALLEKTALCHPICEYGKALWEAGREVMEAAQMEGKLGSIVQNGSA